jgi:hypothetical protein
MDWLGELDLASQDVLIEAVRELEQQLWMIRAQLAQHGCALTASTKQRHTRQTHPDEVPTQPDDREQPSAQPDDYTPIEGARTIRSTRRRSGYRATSTIDAPGSVA